MTNYILASSTEAKRLQQQAQLWEGETELMLDCIGINSGWSCLELGCGAIGILGLLSRRVGLSGRVIGIDSDSSLLTSAQLIIEKEKLTNVKLLERDVNNTTLPRESFDFVHERFVLPHVSSPETMLQEMLDLTRPGGIVAVQEPDHSSWNYFPQISSWPKLRYVLEAAVGLRGDINIGQRTYGMLRAYGLENVKIRAAVLALQNDHPYMRHPINAATALRSMILDAKIVTEVELNALLADIEQSISNLNTFGITYTVTQVWGRKPQR